MPVSKSRSVSNSVALALAALGAAASASAQTVPPPQNVVSLNASATVEVPRDWLTVVFSTTKEGSDAAQVQSELKLALDAALAEARRGARPGQVEVRSGNFSLQPRYVANNQRNAGGMPQISGWLGSTEMFVEGRDVAAISQLAGRVRTLTIARTGFSLSREAREKVETEVSAMAIARFRTRADEVAQAFGFSGWTLREVSVSADTPPMPVPMMRAVAAAAPMSADASLPVEAGTGTVTATVSGSLQLTK